MVSRLIPSRPQEAMDNGKCSVDERALVARGLEEMVSNRYIYDEEVEAQVLPLIMDTFKSPDEHIEDHVVHWAGALRETSAVLGEAKVRSLILPEVKAMSKIYASTTERCMACYMMAAICKMIPKQEAKDHLLAPALALCQDTETPVRKAMACNLAPLASHMGAMVTDEKMLPEIFELMRDEEADVKEAALHTLVDVLDLVPDTSKRDKVAPRIHTIWQGLAVEPSSPAADIFAELNGPIVVKIARVLSAEDSRVLVGCLRGLADPKSSDYARQQTAFNFYAILHSLGVDYMAKGMLSILQGD